MMMDEFGGLESYTPSEGGGGAREQLSEESKQRFAQAQAQLKAMMREEKKAKKRDDRVAQAIVQFLGDDRYSHLFQLIAKLASMDCPSIFILAILSLVHEGSRVTVEEYIAEHGLKISTPDTHAPALKSQELSSDMRQALLQWIARMELVVKIDTEAILKRLMTDEDNVDGTVLQISTFVLQDYFRSIGRHIEYDDLQPLTIKILQDVVEDHLHSMAEYFRELRSKKQGEE
jgi:predicted nucleic acid-binding OB-fold protein